MPNARMFQSPPLSSGAQSLGTSGFAGGGDTHNNVAVHYHRDMSALDSNGTDSILDKHAGRIADAVWDHVSNKGGRQKYR
jgi:hypothetical protein